MNAIPVPRFFIDCGYAAGVLALLLQLASVELPVGEGRDWIYFYAIGGWAAWLIVGSFLVRVGRLKPMPEMVKTVVGAFAFGTLSGLFLSPLVSVWFAWVWVLAVLVACKWVGVKQRWSVLGLAWLVTVSFAMCGTLIYKSPWLALAHDPNAMQYAMAFVALLLIFGPVMYQALTSSKTPKELGAVMSGMLTLGALYLLAVTIFRTDGFGEKYAVYHWKAFVEPAQSLREGGWLLWDVPSLYGFLQTLVIAFLPANSTWQSLYLLNGLLLTMTGGMIFTLLFTRYHSLAGFAGCLLVTLAAVMLVLPTTPDPRLMPNTGVLRFFWTYAMVGYVFHVCRHVNKTAAFPKRLFLTGNLIWLAGALWSVESAVFVTMLWVPSLAFIALGQLLAQNPTPSLGDMFDVLVSKMMLLVNTAIIAVVLIAGYYQVRLGHWPDVLLLSAYTQAYAFGFSTLPITQAGCAPCWLFVFFLLVMVTRSHVAHAYINAHGVLAAGVLYCLVATFWMASGYYIPFSEDFHLTGTLPLIVYLSGIMLLMLPYLTIPPLVERAYEKAIMCFYSVLVLCTVSHFNPGTYTPETWREPINPDITTLLEAPPKGLTSLVEKAKMPRGAQVLVLSTPMEMRDEVTYLERVEGFYFAGLGLHEWLLPNTLVGYEAPLAPVLYKEIAQRRAERIGGAPGWVVEKKDHGLGNYPWVSEAIASRYAEDGRFENEEFLIRKYVVARRK